MVELFRDFKKKKDDLQEAQATKNSYYAYTKQGTKVQELSNLKQRQPQVAGTSTSKAFHKQILIVRKYPPAHTSTAPTNVFHFQIQYVYCNSLNSTLMALLVRKTYIPFFDESSSAFWLPHSPSRPPLVFTPPDPTCLLRASTPPSCPCGAPLTFVPVLLPLLTSILSYSSPQKSANSGCASSLFRPRSRFTNKLSRMYAFVLSSPE